jgi:hypothetical protein
MITDAWWRKQHDGDAACVVGVGRFVRACASGDGRREIRNESSSAQLEVGTQDLLFCTRATKRRCEMGWEGVVRPSDHERPLSLLKTLTAREIEIGGTRLHPVAETKRVPS